MLRGHPPPEWLQSDVAASWQRLLERRADALGGMGDESLSGDEVQRRQKSVLPAARFNTSFIRSLSRYLQEGGLVFLTDAEGYVLGHLGPARGREWEQLFAPGCNWSEEQRGTNAVGLVVREHRPYLVQGPEHYLKALHGLSCAGAPLFSPAKEFLGVLGLAQEGAEKAHPHTLGMVVAAAEAVEQQMGWEMAAEQFQSVVQSISEGLLAIDNQGRITQMNDVAGDIFGLRPHNQVGKSVEEVFHDAFPLLRLIKTGREGFNDREFSLELNERRIHITVTSRPVRSRQGKVFGVVLTFREMKSVQQLVNRMVGAQARFTFPDLVGQDQGFLQAVETARRVARTGSTVLLLGESGTGKEMFAQAIHNYSPRRHGPFVAVNCAALPRDLVASELFGYEEGAFTGAKRGGRPGKFELANGGTLFLDEIGDIPLDTQATLLRVLQDRQVVRIGGHNPTPVEIRIVAATNRNLEEMVEQGMFRLDLFYRFSVVNIRIPPLRERGEDVVHLARFFLQHLGEHYGYEPPELDEEALCLLRAYQWPGNVRELQNLLEQLLHLQEGELFPSEHMRQRLGLEKGKEIIQATPGAPLARVEAEVIRQTLQDCQGNVARAARLLGIGRTTLYRKMKVYGIEWEAARRISN